MITQEERERERALFQAERARVPEQFVREPMIDDRASLAAIGIEEEESEKPLGYLRLMPQDFIVEEIDSRGELHTVDMDVKPPQEGGEGATWYADAVKIGISTLEMRSHLAAQLHVDEKHIGHAGIKDRLALTGQRISIRGDVTYDALTNVTAENFFLKNIERGKGAVSNGELQGNRFVITLRTAEDLSGIAANLETRAKAIAEEGFWNFFSFQRFGTPRLLNRWLGMMLVKEDYEGVVKMFVTHTAPRELPYFKTFREALLPQWGDWNHLKEKLDLFPYHFSIERTMINYLVAHPDDFVGALNTIPDQVRLWFYAYDCYLFNRKLSQCLREGDIPVALPLATSFNRFDWEPYKEYLAEDNVVLPSRAYRNFPFVRVASRSWPTIQKVDVHGVAFKNKLAVFGFSMPKGSYATTFLNNFFTLAAGLPVPTGISKDKIDAKETLGLGSLGPTLMRFKTVLDRREEDVSASEE